MRLVGISGSLRRGSFNTALLRAAVELVPPGVELSVAEIRDIPLYDGDLEARDGIPAAAAVLKEQLAGSDGILIASPEYNNSVPGVLKNAVDWLTRPASDISRVFGGRPVALMGASPGGFGTILGQNAWLPILRTLGTDPWFGGRLMVSRANGFFAPDGALIDDATRKNLRAFVEGFVAFTASRSTPASR